MKKLISVAAVTFAMSVVNSAQGYDGFYVKGEVGGAIFSSDSVRKASKSINPLYGAAVGKKLTHNLRADINFHHKEPTLKFNGNTFKLRQSIILASLYYDFNTNSRFTPYVTAGIGWMFGKINGTIFTPERTIKAEPTEAIIATLESVPDVAPTKTIPASTTTTTFCSNGFAWNIGAGSQVKLSKHVSLDLGYRFMNISNLKNANVPGAYSNPNAHEVALGLVWNM